MSGLPLSNTRRVQLGKSNNLYRLIKTRHVITLLFILALVVGFCVLNIQSLPRTRWASRDSIQPDALEQAHGKTDSTKPSEEEPAPEPLTSLGLEADRSFHLGSTLRPIYKAELEQFVARAFPQSLQGRIRASIDLYLGEGIAQKTLSEIPHEIYQTAKTEPEWGWITSSWRGVEGYRHNFFDDARADRWVRHVFNGTEIEHVWNVFGPGIKRSDLLRYLLVVVQGGIYSDMDTRRLKDISWWGRGADIKGAEDAGPPGVFVGIEADVGTREDWHKWWARPLQVVQWTFAAAPLHPILIDTVRRVCQATALMNARRNQTGQTKETEAHWVGGELIHDGTIPIMEWTGPGIFTDSVLRYLISKHQVTWPVLKDLRRPVRIGDVVVLPVTGFSPGVGMFGADEPTSPEAMVHHLFAGSWKSDARP